MIASPSPTELSTNLLQFAGYAARPIADDSLPVDVLAHSESSGRTILVGATLSKMLFSKIVDILSCQQIADAVLTGTCFVEIHVWSQDKQGEWNFRVEYLSENDFS